jgi:hypothetical protein
VLAVFAAGTAAAQSAGTYDLSWTTLDNGGGTSSGGVYSLSGTIGQADAASSGTASSGGSFVLSPGFWPGVQTAAGPTDTLFKDGFE